MSFGESLSSVDPPQLLWNSEAVQRRGLVDLIGSDIMPFVHLRFGRLIPLYNVEGQLLESFSQDITGRVTLTLSDPTNFLIERILRFIFSSFNEVEDNRTLYMRWGWTDGKREWTQGSRFQESERIQVMNQWQAYSLISWTQDFESTGSGWVLEGMPYGQYLIERVKAVIPYNQDMGEITSQNVENILSRMFLNERNFASDRVPRVRVRFVGEFQENSLNADDGWYQSTGNMTFQQFLKEIVEKRWVGVESGRVPSIIYSSTIIEEKDNQQPLTVIYICDKNSIGTERRQSANWINEQLGIGTSAERMALEQSGEIYSETNLRKLREGCAFSLKYPNTFGNILKFTTSESIVWIDRAQHYQAPVNDSDARTRTVEGQGENPGDAFAPPIARNMQAQHVENEVNRGVAHQTSANPDQMDAVAREASLSPYYAMALNITLLGEPDFFDPVAVLGTRVWMEVDQQPFLDQQIRFGHRFENTPEGLVQAFPILKSLAQRQNGIEGNSVLNAMVNSGLFDPAIKSYLTGVWWIAKFSNTINGGRFETSLTLMVEFLKTGRVVG